MLYLPPEATEEKTKFGKVWTYNLEHSHFCIYKYNDDPRTLYLANVEVDESWRGYGYGRDILKWVKCIAWQHDAERVRLTVEKDSFAHDWYARHGFSDMDVKEPNPGYVWMEKTR